MAAFAQPISRLVCHRAPLDSIFRSVNSYPHPGENQHRGESGAHVRGRAGGSARDVLDGLCAEELDQTRERFERFLAEGRARLDVGDVAPAATHGAIDTVPVAAIVRYPS